MANVESVPEEAGTVVTAGLEDAGKGRIDIGLLVAHTPLGDPDRLCEFLARMASDVADELGGSGPVGWYFHDEEPAHLADTDDRRPAEFLDDATHRMVDGPYDAVVVLTDAPLRSSKDRFVPGLASELGRVAVISTRQLRRAPRGRSRRPLDAPAVRWNAATLLLHLLGHVFGASHRGHRDSVMAPFRFDGERRSVPAFDASVERRLERIAGGIPADSEDSRNLLQRVRFYAQTVFRRPREIGRALVSSRAPLLPFGLPKLATAALTPTLIIVFSAEAWDVGFHMSNGKTVLFAVVSIVAATLYLLFIQNLSFPRGRHRAITEHTALVNVTIFLILLVAMLGLYAIVGTIILAIEFVVFPPNLMSNWPSLEDPAVGVVDIVRTGAFISTIGVLSGALAGGLENRAIIRHLTLFRNEP